MAHDMNKKPTLNDRAAEIGASVPTLRNWKRSGVDVFNDEEVKRHMRTIRKLPPNLKPEFLPKTSETPELTDVSQIDIESLQLKMANAQDKHEAQTLEIQIRGLLTAFKLQDAAGNYISRALVEEEMIRVGAVFKAAVKRLEADLPPMLEGASPETIQRVIGEKADEVLRAMVEEYKKMDNIGRDE